MTSWMPAYFQKRLLRAALSRVGLLDVESLDLDSLGIRIGRTSTVELRNVGLRLEELSALIQLPPNVRLLVARVLSLRLTVPANFFQQSIIAEVDGIDVQVAVDSIAEPRDNSEDSKTPEHRKTARRIHSPPPILHDTGGILSTQRLARSILQDEPIEEKQELEARYMAKSTSSDASDEGVLGTGTSLGLPGVVAGFLQGIIDRVQVKIKDVNFRMSLQESIPEAPSTVLVAHLAQIHVNAALEYSDALGTTPSAPPGKRRRISVQGLGVHLLCKEQLAHADVSAGGLFKSNSQSLSPDDQVQQNSVFFDDEPALQESGVLPQIHFPALSDLSVSTSESVPDEMAQSTASFGIRPGEDNISWTSRRSQSSSDHDQLWSSFAPEEQQSASEILQDMSSSVFLSTIDTRESTHVTPQSPTVHSHASSQSSRSASKSSFLHHNQSPQTDTHNYRDDANEGDTGPFQTAVSPLESDDGNDLSKSVVYSQAEAESMYMSAVSHGPGSPDLKALPGAWGSIIEDNEDADPPFLSQYLEHQPGYESEDRASTPRLQSHTPESRRGSEADSRDSKGPASRYISKEVLIMPELAISIRQTSAVADSAQNAEDLNAQGSMSASIFHQQAPGAFSIYAEGGRSTLRFNDSTRREAVSGLDETPEIDQRMDTTIEIDAKPINLQVDADTLRLIYGLVESIKPTAHSPSRTTEQDNPTSPQKLPRLSLQLETFRIRLFQDLPETVVDSTELPSWRSCQSLEHDKAALLQLEVLQFSIQTLNQTSPLDANLNIGNLTFTAGTNPFLYFDHPKVHPQGQKAVANVISITTRSKTTIQGQSIREIDARVLPIRLNLDLVRFDDDFDALGGLSGIVEMSSSLLSSGAFSNKPDTSPQPRKGVRFEKAAAPEKSNSVQTKVNARLEGFNITLASKACTLEVQASKTKLVSREKAIAVVIGKISLAMPTPSTFAGQPDFDIALGDVKFFYHFSPEEQDLARLLSLVTPTKNKYENDDDILIETLMTQRRKGSVLRIDASSFEGHFYDWAFVSHLKSLGEELSQLSAVAKYLPEDDTPGVLSLVYIHETRIHMPVNQSFGSAEILLKDTQLAQIGLPALLALSVGNVQVGPVGGDPIVHEVLPGACKIDLPMIMARMIGDEVEPVVKVKLFNTCVEYSVPTLLALTSTENASEAEQKVQELAASILEISASGFRQSVYPVEKADKLTESETKKLAVDVLLLDCALALQPRDMSAKGMLLLKNTRFSTIVPPAELFEAALEIREAAFLIVDCDVTASPSSPSSTTPASQPGHSVRLQAHLLNKGYVSVCSIRSAQALVSVLEGDSETEKYVDVELRDEFFLLETCADSTQTLIAILNGLSPPTIANDDPKFRTEAESGLMTLDDMVNSFSGEAFVKPENAPSALFDADEDLSAPGGGDLLAESGMSSSVYGPPEGTMGIEDDDFYGEVGLESDTVESLLEQDPFEMTSSPLLSDEALLRSLRRELGTFPEFNATMLKPFYQDDRKLDKIYGGSRALGEAHEQHKKFPIQVRVRDVNIIWNLYDGYDWQKTRETITHAVEEVEMKLEERKLNRRRSNSLEEETETVIGDCLFNSIYIGVPAARDPSDLRHSISQLINQGNDAASETESYATSGMSRPTQASLNRQHKLRKKRLRLQRSRSHKLGFELKRVSLDFLVHPSDSGEVQSSIDVRVTDFEIFDHVPTSTWKKFLTLHDSKNNKREMMKPMMHLEILNVRPVPELAATEMTIRASILPLRLHVDQDALEFMTRFFDFKDDSSKASDTTAEPPFIQRLEVNTVTLCLDYKPKKVDYGGLRSGRMSEFKNFVILEKAHIKLKHAIVYGLRGFDTLHDTLSDIWTPDVIQNQLSGVLAGLGMIRPVVDLGAGIRDIVTIPVSEIRKDGFKVRSVQKGAVRALSTTSSGFARLIAKVAIGTGTRLQEVEDMLSPAPRRLSNQGLPDVEGEYEESQQRLLSNYADQPLGVLQGLNSARRYLERDLTLAKDAVIAVQGELMVSGSAAGAARAVARHAPTILLQPVIGVSRAVGQTFQGVGNQVDRDYIKKAEDKYKRH